MTRVAHGISVLAGLVLVVSLPPARAGADVCDPALVSAVERGDVPSVAAVLDAGAEIRCVDETGSTMLHHLVVEWADADDDEGQPSGPVVKLLIDRGADPNALDANGKTPLMLACVLEKSDAVQSLLAAGANPNAAGTDSSSALEYAMRGGDVDLVTTLLRGGANPNQRISGDGLPLINAVTLGSATLVDVLLRAGADPNLTSAMGTSPMDHARQSGNDAMVAQLQKPVPPEQRLKIEPAPLAVAVPPKTGGTNLKLTRELTDAIVNKQYAKMEECIAKGADVNAPGLGVSPVLFAAQLGNLEALDILLKHHGTMNTSNNEGDTPLIHVVNQNDEPLLKALISRKADPDYLSSKGVTALMHASVADNLKFVKILLDAGADPNVKGYLGMTALFYAAKDNHTEVVKELLKHKANPNVVEDQFGATPLILAMSSGQIESLKALVDAGADPTIVMKGQYAGLNAIDVAKQAGAPEFVKLLEKAKPKK